MTRHSIGFLVAGIISPVSSMSEEWTTYHLQPPGMRPRLAISSDGSAHIAYVTTGLFERDTTYYGLWNRVTESFALTRVDTGAFDEHIDIELDLNEAPRLTHHTHIGGDVIYSSLTQTGWVRERLSTPGHDGFATSLKFDTANNPHILFSDPGVFGGQGLEYAWHDGTHWNYELPGSGPSVWALYDITLELEPDGTVHGVYHDTLSSDFLYARRTGSTWTISPIDDDGDNGKFSSMKLSPAGISHVAYYHYINDSHGIIKLASYDGDSWSKQNIDSLYNVRVGPQVKPQSMISLDIDGVGNVHISYSDRSVLRYAVVSDSGVTREEVFRLSGSDTTLGQSTSIDVAPDGSVHLAFWLRQQGANLNWPVYMVKSGPPVVPPTAPVISGIPDQTILSSGQFTQIRADNYVSDPDDPDESLVWTWTGNSALRVLWNDTRRSIRVRTGNGWIGSETIIFTVTDPGGLSDKDTVLFTAIPAVVAMALPEGTQSLAEAIPDDFEAAQNYPNPFNATSTIRYGVPVRSMVSVVLFNLLGQQIAVLEHGERGAGNHSVHIDGSALGSGTYFYRLVLTPTEGAGSSFVETRKIMLLK